ncbi:hypothetical protein GGR28_003488 [Lewinella aquimaris]|uniref:Polymerase beta nucleotidyltransferase domain-containing protein n=1 Tax=Neolewinella aquimaris TaxID=1835722 RepID=A0A840EGB1_9BACT|nr:nucleotidyltransferase domain-containing protein [Neolewinella aquimaris]MBB4080849.1 hypothetical protein [Neolewinella aquimaris]
MQLLQTHINQLTQACRAHQVEELYAFGSILTDKFTDESDVDLIVSIEANDPMDYAEHYFELKFEIERILDRGIDLLEAKAVKNPLFEKVVNQEKRVVYAKENKRVA